MQLMNGKIQLPLPQEHGNIIPKVGPQNQPMTNGLMIIHQSILLQVHIDSTTKKDDLIVIIDLMLS